MIREHTTEIPSKIVVPEHLQINRAIIEGLRRLDDFASLSTLETVATNILKLCKNKNIRKEALPRLWRANRSKCIEISRRFVEANPRDLDYLLQHAQFCADYYLPDTAAEQFEKAIKAARHAPITGDDIETDSVSQVLLEYFHFLSKIGRFDKAKQLSGQLSSDYRGHASFSRGMFLIHLSEKNSVEASEALLAFMSSRKRRAWHSRLLIQQLAEMNSSGAWQLRLEDTETFLQQFCESADELVLLLKIAILTGDITSARHFWMALLQGHTEYLEAHPEIGAFAESNISNSIFPLIFPKIRSDDERSEPLPEDKYRIFHSIAASGARGKSKASGSKVSVILTAYNAESTISYAVTSILNQTYSNFEIIFVDDQSSDETVSIMKRFAADDSRIKIIQNERNMGPYNSRNMALKIADGDFIAIHDADDIALPDRLALQIAAFSDGVMAVIGSHLRLDTYGRVCLENDGAILGHGPMTVVFRKEIISDIGEFCDVRTRGDKEFESRIANFYGSDALKRIQDVIVLALHETSSNSHLYTNNDTKRRELMLFKSWYRRKHSAGEFDTLKPALSLDFEALA